jgi:hypothetical protein
MIKVILENISLSETSREKKKQHTSHDDENQKDLIHTIGSPRHVSLLDGFGELPEILFSWVGSSCCQHTNVGCRVMTSSHNIHLYMQMGASIRTEKRGEQTRLVKFDQSISVDQIKSTHLVLVPSQSDKNIQTHAYIGSSKHRAVSAAHSIITRTFPPYL